MDGPFSGEVYVFGGSRRREGARKGCRHAGTKSRASLAGPSDGSGTTDGGSANSSNARSSGRTENAGSADGSGDEQKRAPIPGKEQWAPVLEYPEKELQPLKELPGTPWAFTKAVNECVQLVGVARAMLGNENHDVRVRQRLLEQLLDMAYGKNARGTEEEGSFKSTWNVPGPARD